MSYLVLARKYRPKTFDDIVGQDHIVTTLKNAIRSDHIAHAYLFAGPRGIGKTSMARILSKAINCHTGITISPCNECDICKCISNGNDIDVLEIDGASNRGIDSIRDLRQNVKYVPSRSRFKIYIIDEVHMLTKEAFNALLKTLEEPPPHVKFIFATTDADKLPETVQSRCQRFDFKNVTIADIIKRLAKICNDEGVAAEQSALEAIAAYARGGLRDSQSILDQLIAYSTDKITLKDVYTILGTVDEGKILQLVSCLISKDTRTALQITHEALNNGKDIIGLIEQLLWHLRNLLIVHTCGFESTLLGNLPDDVQTFYKSNGETLLSGRISPETLLYMIQVLSETKRRAKDDILERILFETAVVRLTTMQDMRPLSEVLERLETIEKKLSQGNVGATLAVAQNNRAGAIPAPTLYSEEIKNDAPLTDIWRRVLTLVQSRKNSTWSLLQHGEPIKLENGEIVIGFSKKFFKEQLEHSEERTLIEQCIEEILGRKIRAKMVLSEGIPMQNGECGMRTPEDARLGGRNNEKQKHSEIRNPNSEVPNSVEAEPVVRKALELFGGSVVNVRRQGK
ncbi:MAG TPA: DNA polymerase III subunit gamma/tau [Candidatus Brocadiales bacterium]|nr:DNA polymerase III subunit gamma/tau [Candidatus Brocadiales bacterium]